MLNNYFVPSLLVNSFLTAELMHNWIQQIEHIIDLEAFSLLFCHQVSSRCVPQTYGVHSIMLSPGEVFGARGAPYPGLLVSRWNELHWNSTLGLSWVPASVYLRKRGMSHLVNSGGVSDSFNAHNSSIRWTLLFSMSFSKVGKWDKQNFSDLFAVTWPVRAGAGCVCPWAAFSLFALNLCTSHPIIRGHWESVDKGGSRKKKGGRGSGEHSRWRSWCE